MGRRRVLARAVAAAAVALSMVLSGGAAGRAAPVLAAGPPSGQSTVLDQFQLPNGDTATVYDSGVVQLMAADHKHVTYRAFPGIRAVDGGSKLGLFSRAQLVADLTQGTQQQYVPDTLLVAFAPGVTVPQDVVSAAAHSASPALTSDAATNRLLGTLGADRVERLFRTFDRAALSAMSQGVRTPSGAPALDISSVYRVHVTGVPVPDAAGELLQSKAAVYASPDWTVSSAQSNSVTLPPAAAGQRAANPTAASVPTNFAVANSSQSLLNAPGTNSVAAYDEIGQYLHQLPGQGEIVTNVSVGDLYDSSAASNPSDPCHQFASSNGPTTEVTNGQRFLDLPSMPLIPTYTADTAGNLNGQGEVCGVDQTLGEVGLDFSVMSPLPHDQQRTGEVGSGPTDLLGIAPGASYRLVVPASSAPGISDIDGALLGAGMQSPQPNVISTSLGFGFDTTGFPGRYLEEDPLTESLISSLVQSRGIIVSISANDGTRTFTNAAIGPDGGAAPTNTGTPTSLNDVRQSTVPSQVADSGAIDAGGTTLDDVFAAPPQFAGSEAAAAVQAYPETRWTGFTSFASGFGSRVNLSAPADNVVALNHHPGGSFDAVDVVLSGGTSASAPEVAAAAAVVQQVARVTGHPFASPGDVRSFLIANADAVPQVPQADTTLNVGPELDLGRAVESLLRQGGITVTPAAPRVAVAQRRDVALLDGAFQTDTDPTNIDLQGPAGTDRDQLAWITIAPDWEGLISGTTFSLTVAGTNTRLANSRWARLLPSQILAAAGLPVASTTSRTVQLTYQANSSGTIITQNVSLTFGPADATVNGALAPNVPAVVTGSQIAVTYDLTGVSGLSSPMLLVSEPGRVDPSTGNVFRAAFSQPLTATKGTVDVPVSALTGGGIYGVGIQLGTQSNGATLYSDFAFTRVVPVGASRPAAPLLSSGGSTPGHFLEIPFNGSVKVSWNVSNVPGADGALIEFGAPGPGILGDENTFNNPNGTGRDANGVDFGSVSATAVSGTTGSTTLGAGAAGLTAAMAHVVRIVATHGGSPVGEASDVGTVVRDGVRPADGGFVNDGFGIDPSGTTGLITSGQHDAAGNFESTVETFDQSSYTIKATVETSTAPLHTFQTPGWGVWGGGVGLVGNGNLGTGSFDSYNVIDPVSGGTLGPAWTPPSGGTPLAAASNEVDANGAFIYRDPTTGKFPVFTSNIPANTFSSLFDTSAALPGLSVPELGGFDENTSTRTGVAVFSDATQGCSAPDTILTTDLASGSSSSFAGTGTGGFPFGIAVDSTTNHAAVIDACSTTMSIYDLASHTGTVITFPSGPSGTGSPGDYLAVDPQHGLFLVERMVGGDVGFNNNALSQLLVYNEQGQLVSNIEKTNVFGIPAFSGVHNLQVDPGRRIVYGFGPGFQELQPLGY